MMAKDTFLNRKFTLNSNGTTIDLSKPTVMAILNLTSDSFYNKSRSNSITDALTKAEMFLSEGVQLIDIGANSSRPGAIALSTNDELQRLIPVVSAIAQAFPTAHISIDTFRAKVAEEAISAGAHVINDISGGALDGAMFETIAKLQVPYIMMHMKGTPQNMQEHATYENVVNEVCAYFESKIEILKKLGVNDIIIDPGFGFAKTVSHNYQLLQQLDELQKFDLPLLVGFSRKSMITKVLKNKTEEALNGTTVLNTIALSKGASILRVHDVKEAMECIALTEKIKNP
jgi:dihydropteroate synthase